MNVFNTLMDAVRHVATINEVLFARALLDLLLVQIIKIALVGIISVHNIEIL